MMNNNDILSKFGHDTIYYNRQLIMLNGVSSELIWLTSSVT